MSYKTFNFRSGYGSWSNVDGKGLTLFGNVNSYKTAKTFRNVKIVKLVEKAVKPSEIIGDTWTILASAELLKKCQEFVDQKTPDQRPELIIKSNGKNIQDIFACMSYSD
jgi:hypothetical protein